MMIAATTRIDYETYRRFFLFSLFHGRRASWQAPFLIALTPALAIAFLILYLIDRSDLLNLLGFVMMLFICLILAAIVTIMPRRYYQTMEKQLMAPTYYCFFATHLTVNGELTSDLPTDYAYSKIERAYETADAFYINLGPGSICIISRTDFTIGTAEDLHDLLCEKLGEKLLIIGKKSQQC